MILVEPGSRDARHEPIRIDGKSGGANGFLLLGQEGMERRPMENVQCAGIDSAFPWAEHRSHEAARRGANCDGFRRE